MKPKMFFILIVLLATFTTQAQKSKKTAQDEHTFLGVDVDGSDRWTNGLYLNGVYKGFNAEKAGLRRGDTLVAINGKAVHRFSELIGTLDKYKPGQQVEVSVKRDNRSQNLSVTLSEYPEFLRYNKTQVADKTIRAKLGINVEPVWELYATKITDFDEDSPAQKAGLKEGDVVLRMDNYQFATIEELRYFLSKYKPGNQVSLSVDRNGKTITIPVVLGEEVYEKDKKKD